MGYKVQKANFRVIVEPRGPGNFGFASIGGMTRSEDEWTRYCEDIISQINRHVNDVQSVYFECDAEKVCEHCGWAWTDGDDSEHNGGCCDEDRKVYDACEDA